VPCPNCGFLCWNSNGVRAHLAKYCQGPGTIAVRATSKPYSRNHSGYSQKQPARNYSNVSTARRQLNFDQPPPQVSTAQNLYGCNRCQFIGQTEFEWKAHTEFMCPACPKCFLNCGSREAVKDHICAQPDLGSVVVEIQALAEKLIETLRCKSCTPQKPPAPPRAEVVPPTITPTIPQ